MSRWNQAADLQNQNKPKVLTSSSPPSSSLSFFLRSIGGGMKLVIWMQSSRKYSETRSWNS